MLIPRTTVTVLLLLPQLTVARSVIDLSYLQHVDSSRLVGGVSSTDVPLGSKLDLTSSDLGDDGFFSLISSLQERRIQKLSLKLPLNRITAAGATKALGLLLSKNDEKWGNETSRLVEIMDLSWNNLSKGNEKTREEFHDCLEQLFADSSIGPREWQLSATGLGVGACRAMGQGIIQRYSGGDPNVSSVTPRTLSLSIPRNPSIGDGGAAALAAALRLVVDDHPDHGIIFDILDLSGCDVGDMGVEALALALEGANSCCIVRLVLGKNPRITDKGVSILAQAIQSCSKSPIRHLDLSTNKEIGDAAASKLADAFGSGKLPSLSVRSCHIHADGAGAFGGALRELRTCPSPISHKREFALDLSGNPLGILRGKHKTGRKYSASQLKSKATATAASYMNILKKGLAMGPESSAESDDEEENSNDGSDEDENPSNQRCGAKAMANEFLDVATDPSSGSSDVSVSLGLRHCFFDHAAADALAALMVNAASNGIRLSLDVNLNSVLEDEMVSALHGDAGYGATLDEMSERFLDLRETLQEAKQRARVARSRVSTIIDQSDDDGAWNLLSMDLEGNNEEFAQDSDDDYAELDDYDY